VERWPQPLHEPFAKYAHLSDWRYNGHRPHRAVWRAVVVEERHGERHRQWPAFRWRHRLKRVTRAEPVLTIT
jgi:hypothetical protein